MRSSSTCVMSFLALDVIDAHWLHTRDVTRSGTPQQRAEWSEGLMPVALPSFRLTLLSCPALSSNPRLRTERERKRRGGACTPPAIQAWDISCDSVQVLYLETHRARYELSHVPEPPGASGVGPGTPVETASPATAPADPPADGTQQPPVRAARPDLLGHFQPLCTEGSCHHGKLGLDAKTQ